MARAFRKQGCETPLCARVLKTPRSAMRPVTRWLGVTSKAGFRPRCPRGRPELARFRPPRCAPGRGWSRAKRAPRWGCRRGRRPPSSRWWRGKGDVEGNPVVARRERLQVGADLVADVAPPGGAVGADEHHVDEPALHEMCRPRCRRCRSRRSRGMYASSHAVSAPWLRGRVSSTQTCTGSLRREPGTWGSWLPLSIGRRWIPAVRSRRR